MSAQPIIAQNLSLSALHHLNNNLNDVEGDIKHHTIPMTLTLVLLNKLSASPTSNFQPIKLLDPDCCYKFTYLMAVQIQIS